MTGTPTRSRATLGFPLGAAGFANLSFEYGGADPTDRSVQRADAAALIAAGNDAVADPAQIWGNPTIDGDLKLFGNFGSLFAGDLQFYGHASYADKKVTEGFYFRNPNTRQNIYTLDGGETLLIGDALQAAGRGSANCPTVRDYRPRAGSGRARPGVRGPELLLLPGDRARGFHAPVRRRRHGHVGGRRAAPHLGVRPDLGRRRQLRRP